MLLLPLIVPMLLGGCSWAAVLPAPHPDPASHGTDIPDSQGCQADSECHLGMRCISGNCTEGVNVTGTGAECDPSNDQCAPEFCCSKTESGMLPLCAPFPAEGERCKIQPISLWNLLQMDSATGSDPGYCPCASGLVCTNKGFNLIYTCEKPDGVLDFTTYGGESLLQPLVRRDEELTYYDSDLIPWPSQPDQFIDLPRAAEESARESKNVFKVLHAGAASDVEEESLLLDEHADEQPDPGQLEFQELKQLARQIGQYFGPDFY
ncbi:hypothetical protein XENTR_v10019336 [Xenopus tropicalis]|uniref:Uncharacterized LOC100495217 n=1 Tax=Xenopus tropicalis TaxID=8364 RepID=A0A6I8R7J2_XENTR|nr:uncharacterized protein LOC100495217 isoform X1 [Xenopus tropicalis]KAE8593827.1 hypothetical protein XENTR_v10019336 [Xenopus tropicalis]|eukprot:XP_002938559.2 PREDICTED: uncharacterized protein LOC100495217 isoform X2 [Xenopus tropicalis]